MRRLTGITRSRLRPEALAGLIASPRHGAAVTFIGSVRTPHAGRRVRAVSYDCFVPLAEKELARITAAAEKRWPARVAAFHRVGRVKTGEASVFVAAAAAHRALAFEACRFVIDEIKLRLPIWKLEHYEKGEGRWLDGCSLRRRRGVSS